MKKFLLIPLVIILIAGLCLTGACKKGPVLGTTITSAVPDFVYESTDPNYMESLWGWMMYDSLLRWDENGNFIAGVADSWEVSEDGCTWTFKIHKGIKFHNGEDLTAEDVKFSVDRFGHMTPDFEGDPSVSSNPWSKYISEVYNKVSSRVVDDYTFEFVSAYAEPAQAIAFAWTRILPKDYYESVGIDEFRAHPIGSGPWKWVELVSKTSMKLEANADYWRKDEIPHYQYYVELMVPELATRISMLKTGECDMAAVDYDRIDDLVDEGFKTETFMPPGTCSMFFQGTWLPGAGATANLKVRQAMSYALNRQEIVDTWFSGYGDPTAGQFYMYPGCFGWSDALRTDPYDPDKARDLLEEAGYYDLADPVIHIYTTAMAGLYGGQDFVLLLISYWEAVGLQVQMEVVDGMIAAGYTFQGFFGAPIKEGDTNVGWIGIWNYQAFFNCTYHSANMYCPGGAHCTSNDAHAKELYDKAAKELDPELSAQYFNEFQVYVRSLYINIGICLTDNLVLYNPDTIGGWDSNARLWVSMWDAMNGVHQP